MMIRQQHLTGHISSTITIYDYFIALTEEDGAKKLTVLKAGSPDQTVVWTDGVDGTGIESVKQNADTSLSITLTDGKVITTDPLKGDRGDVEKLIGVYIDDNGHLIAEVAEDSPIDLQMTDGRLEVVY